MHEAHISSGHRGRDATLARFRYKYWTPYGSKMSKSVKDKCYLCRKREPKFLGQEMGNLPPERTQPSLPFTSVMLDLFGPILVKGEVQRRTTDKAYGVLFTDICSRAIHIEIVFGYDTDSFLLSLRRFAAIRGWPAIIYSDPGSQLVCADKEIRKSFRAFDKAKINKMCTDHGLR